MFTTLTTKTNPFTFEYLEKELAFYNLPKDYKFENTDIKVVNRQFMGGQLDDYLNTNFYTETFQIPSLFIGGKIWMSVTPLEIQSAYLALKRANGVISTCGLGLGYYALRAALKDEVERVDVYEINDNIISWFLETFKDRKEIEKINIIAGNVFDNLKGKTYNYVFMDRYQTLLSDEVISDIYHFSKSNTIKRYDFWGQERVLFSSWNTYKLSTPLDYQIDASYFRQWANTCVGNTEHRLISLYHGDVEKEYCKEVCKALRWLRKREYQ